MAMSRHRLLTISLFVLLSAPVTALAGLIFIESSTFPSLGVVGHGETEIKPISPGVFEVTTRGLELEGTVRCGDNPACPEEFDGEPVRFVIDLKLVVNRDLGTVRGRTRGVSSGPPFNFDIPGLSEAFRGEVDGSVRCRVNACDLIFRARSRLEATELDSGWTSSLEDGAGISELRLRGTLGGIPDNPAWGDVRWKCETARFYEEAP